MSLPGCPVTGDGISRHPGSGRGDSSVIGRIHPATVSLAPGEDWGTFKHLGEPGWLIVRDRAVEARTEGWPESGRAWGERAMDWA